MERGGKAATARRFEALDGWRGIAALMVVLLHAPVETALTGSGFVRHAFLFVDFFFVLSGFVIAHASAARLGRTRDLRGFLVGRLARVYPLHLFMLALFVAYEAALYLGRGPDAAFQGGNGLEALAHNLLMTHSLGTVSALGWNYPSWSISAELLAYGLFALAVLALGKRVGWGLALVPAVALPVLFLAVGHMDTTVAFGWLRCLFGFSIGAIVRLALWPRMAPAASAHRGVWTVAEVAAMLLVAVFVNVAGTTPLSLAAPFVFAYALLVFAHEGGAVSQMLRSRPIAFLGLVSYSVYMTHAFVISRFVNLGTVLEGKLGLALMAVKADGSKVFVVGEARGLAVLAAILAATLLASALTWRFVEVPGQRLGRRLAGGGTAPKAAPAELAAPAGA